MATGWKGLATGALALVALEVLVQPAAAGRVGALFGAPARVARRFLDPSIPAIPERSGGDDIDAIPSLSTTPAPASPFPFATPGQGVLA